MPNYGKHYAMRAPTPQSQPIPSRENEQIENSARGFVFGVGDWAMLDRFLILGSEGGSYYAGERELTITNAKAVERCIVEDGQRAVARIVEISDAGRAPKNDPALFALALCASAKDVGTRRAALAAMPKVARIGTHLFKFVDYVQGQRGWGRALRRAIGDWYNLQPVDKLAYGAVKYQQREGWSNRDLLRLSHPETTDPSRRAVYDWMCGRARPVDDKDTPSIIGAFESLKGTPNAITAIANINAFNLPREAIPTDLLNDAAVWKALLAKMPLQAMVRNLGKMTAIKVLDALQPGSALKVIEQLGNVEAIHKARLHPLSLLIALKTYAQGRGVKGNLSWSPVPAVIDALDASFYHAFQAVEPTNKRIMLALDVSGSMGGGSIAGSSLTPREGSAAMALVTAATERAYVCVGFTSGGASRRGLMQTQNGLTPLPITAKQRLDDVVRMVSDLPFGGTDCALPMLFALENSLKIDAFVIYTDSETWAGAIHPIQALQKYREQTGINAKLVVVGMVSNGFTIADPNDPGMLDVVGFDTATPAVIADFIRG